MMQRVSKGFYVPCGRRAGLDWFLLESKIGRKDRTREGSAGEGRQRRGQEREEGAEKQWHF